MSEQVKGIPERAPEPPYMDFPEAWAFVRTTKLEDHHMRCSWRSGVLCDCNVLWAEYYKRKAARSEQALAALEAYTVICVDHKYYALHGATNCGDECWVCKGIRLSCELESRQQQVAALEARNGENAALLGALKLALVTIDAFWPNDRPENQAQVDEDRAIAKVRKLARAALAEAKKENK